MQPAIAPPALNVASPAGALANNNASPAKTKLGTAGSSSSLKNSSGAVSAPAKSPAYAHSPPSFPLNLTDQSFVPVSYANQPPPRDRKKTPVATGYSDDEFIEETLPDGGDDSDDHF